jgi:hypothetical protein
MQNSNDNKERNERFVVASIIIIIIIAITYLRTYVRMCVYISAYIMYIWIGMDSDIEQRRHISGAHFLLVFSADSRWHMFVCFTLSRRVGLLYMKEIWPRPKLYEHEYRAGIAQSL